jgi:tetratricopeptide (TPR) repeat protein
MNNESCIKENNPYACHKIADTYKSGSGVEKNMTKALEYDMKGCNLHHYESCLGAFSIYITMGDLKEGEKLLSEHTKESQIDNINYQMGKAYYGIGNFKSATYFYDKACEENVVTACKINADLYQRGVYSSKVETSIQTDINKCNSYLLKACELKDTYSCNELGRYYERTKNIQNANIYWDKACSYGDCYYKNYQIRKEKEEQEVTKRKELEVLRLNNLRNRHGQYVFGFYPSFQWINNSRYLFTDRDIQDLCNKACSNATFDNNPYSSLQEALDDKWVFVAKLEETTNQISDSCICNGTSYLLEKK